MSKATGKARLEWLRQMAQFMPGLLAALGIDQKTLDDAEKLSDDEADALFSEINDRIPVSPRPDNVTPAQTGMIDTAPTDTIDTTPTSPMDDPRVIPPALPGGRWASTTSMYDLLYNPAPKATPDKSDKPKAASDKPSKDSDKPSKESGKSRVSEDGKGNIILPRDTLARIIDAGINSNPRPYTRPQDTNPTASQDAVRPPSNVDTDMELLRGLQEKYPDVFDEMVKDVGNKR